MATSLPSARTRTVDSLASRTTSLKAPFRASPLLVISLSGPRKRWALADGAAASTNAAATSERTGPRRIGMRRVMDILMGRHRDTGFQPVPEALEVLNLFFDRGRDFGESQ